MVKKLLLNSERVPEIPDIERRESIHSTFIKGAIPDWVTSASLQRIGDLRTAPKVLPEWSKTASCLEHLAAKDAMQASWQAQSRVDQMLGKLQDVVSFAQPLLTRALNEQYGLKLDVRETFCACITRLKHRHGRLTSQGESVVEPSLYLMHHCKTLPKVKYLPATLPLSPGLTKSAALKLKSWV